MPHWSQRVPRLADSLLHERVRKHRRRVLIGLQGVVVEIGFGTGRNVPLYPREVEQVYAVDPSVVSWRMAARRIDASPIPVRFAGLDGRHLFLDDGSMDSALSTFTLCTIPDVVGALHELFRVMRKGGHLHFLEHGLSPAPGTARWQHRLNGVQQRVAGGCRLDLRVDQLIRQAGFRIEELRAGHVHELACSRPWNYLYEGVATKPAV